jgi:hypothetical protein
MGKTYFLLAKKLLVMLLIVGALVGVLGGPEIVWAAQVASGDLIVPKITKPGSLPDVPIVFVSRHRVANWKLFHLGPPVDVQGRELTLGGRLLVWRPDGSVTDLTKDSGLFDVQQPDVSFSGDKVVFSAVTGPDEQWRLWEIGLNGSGLRQLTFSDRDIAIPDNPQKPGVNQEIFGRYGDFGPAYLPDGRIIFASTRYMTLSGSCSQRGQNLYVLNPETGKAYRRTTDRAGAFDPAVLNDGRIVFSHYVDAMNTPARYGSGLRPLLKEYNFGPSFWGIWAMNPDGTGAGRYAFLRGGLVDDGGVHQPRQLPNGNLVVSYRAMGTLLGDPLASAVTIIRPGACPLHELRFLGNPSVLEAPHACGPAPLPDGRIALSYTPTTKVSMDPAGIRSAEFDFGLYLADKRLEHLTLVYNDPEMDELDACAAVQRSAPVIPDCPQVDMITDDPAIDLGKTAKMINSNVYADLPLKVCGLPSPRVGTVAWVEIYDDSQTFETSDEFPLLKKQMPRFIQRFPVMNNGSFEATVPADRALLFVLVNKDGVAVRSPMSPQEPDMREQTVTHSFNGHDYLRPDDTIRCTGCHKGHMIKREQVYNVRANLARLAVASASSERDRFFNGAHRINDLRLADPRGAYAWSVNWGGEAWVRLDWQVPIKMDSLTLFPLTGADIGAATLILSNNTELNLGPLPRDGSPVKLSFPKAPAINWLTFKVDSAGTGVVGLSEIVVNGPIGKLLLSETPPPVPVNLTIADATMCLRWDRNKRRTDEPSVAGYRIYYGTAPGTYESSLDVGNVTTFLMGRQLADGVTYFFTVKSYNVYGMESESASNEVQGTVRVPKVIAVEPNHGPVGGETRLVITGENFASWGVRVLLSFQHVHELKVVDDKTITCTTHFALPGPVDVEVLNPGDQYGILVNGFSFDQP